MHSLTGLLFVAALLLSVSVWAQTDTLSNSYAETLAVHNPHLKYRYLPETQTHDYSGNWDLDADSLPDDVYFIGTGGAHLYYFLRVVLSTEKEPRDYNFLQTDLPLLPADSDMQMPGFNPVTSGAQFVVGNFMSDSIFEIYVRLDKATQHAFAKQLRERNLKTKYILLYLRDSWDVIVDYENAKK